MFQKSIYLLTVILAIAMTSCTNNGNQAATKEAQEVEVVTTENAATLTTVKEGSAVSWRASHLGGVQPRFGQVLIKDASVVANKGELVNATVSMDLASLTVENFPEGAPEKAKLTGHLLSPDFFNIEKYPVAKFELTESEKTTGAFNSKVTGNLTILEATKSITFNANVTIGDNEVSIESEDFAINRTDWGLTYNTEGTKGVPVDYLIANDIGFTIRITVSK